MEMGFGLQLVLIVMIFASIVQPITVPPEVRRPPTIVSQPKDIVYAIPQIDIKLPCVAAAQPRVKSPEGYIWQRDNEQLNLTNSGITMSSTDGNLTFQGNDKLDKNAMKVYEGVYQCFATNALGTAMSHKVTVKVSTALDHMLVKKDIPINAKEGQPLMLPCNYSKPGERDTKWIFNPDTTTLSRRISEQDNGGLVFSHVSSEDDNLELWCEVKDIPLRNSKDGPHYILSVQKVNPVPTSPASIVSPELKKSTAIFLRGSTIKLTCVATGNPTPDIKWTKLSGAWPKDRKREINNGQTMIVKNATLSDAVAYKCSASNSAGSAIKIVEVKLESKPYFTSERNQPHDVIKIPGDNVTIRCNPQGTPTPTTEWMVNGVPINETDPMDNRIIHHKSIKLTNLQANYSAVYQCISSNKHGVTIAQAYVNVLTSKPIQDSNNQLMYIQVEKKHITMKCHFFGSPPPNITWMKNGKDVTLMERFKLLKNKYLAIENLQLDDSGNYSCVAKNDYGTDSITVGLNVLTPTRLENVIGETRIVIKGKSINLEVKVHKDPELSLDGEITWEKDGVFIGTGSQYQIADADFNNSGIYKITVRTTKDHATSYQTLSVIDTPQPPQNFTFQEDPSNPMQVIFSWKPGADNYSPILGYRIEFEEDVYEPGTWHKLETIMYPNGTSTPVQLSPGVQYQFRALARNVAGWSKSPSLVTERYKTPDSLPMNPIGLRGKGETPRYMTIQWVNVPVLKRNGPGFGYQVSYRPANGSGKWKQFNVTDKSRVVVRGNRPYQQYLVRVRSYNVKGFASEIPEAITVYTGEDVPLEAPTDVKVKPFEEDPTKIKISWKLVDEESISGIPLGYKILYKITGSDEEFIKTVDNIPECEIDGLSPATEYEFQVAVFNSAEMGPRSSVSAIMTPVGTPGAVEVEVTADVNQANVTWMATANGVPTEQYLVQYKKEGGKWIELDPLDQDSRFVTIDNLESGTSYIFRVVSINALGSETSLEVAAKTSGPGLATGGITGEVWFIVIMCLLGLLVLVVLIICFVKRNKGGKYSVADKEHHLVESQLMHENSGEYNDETDDVKKPLSSGAPANGNATTPSGDIPSDIPLRTRGDSVAGDSIEAFGDADANEFNEDGSFIGQYGIITGDSSSASPTTPPGGEDIQNKHPKGDPV